VKSEVVLRQTQVESENFENVTRALEFAIALPAAECEPARRLSSIRFETVTYVVWECDAICERLQQVAQQVLDHIRYRLHCSSTRCCQVSAAKHRFPSMATVRGHCAHPVSNSIVQ
jgi:hypothetical protein